jgi:LDH2 family malate/lactate/ureidoglycolate dehydrogenase
VLVPIFPARQLRKVTAEIFSAVGASNENAETVAHSLVEANLLGHDSHGVIRIIEYVKQVRSGALNPLGHPEIVHETPTTVRVDGNRGFGQIVAGRTMDHLVAKARDNYTSAGTIFNCGHVGMVGAYPAMAASQGMIGFAMVNGGGNTPRVAPFGGKVALFGTNPMAAAIPGTESPLVIDFSTSVAASGKIRVSRDTGTPLPEGWIIDREGKPSTNPKDYYDGGMLLPAAGHKGHGLSILVEIMAGLLSGAGVMAVSDTGYQGGNGCFFMVINVEAFRPQEQFVAEVGKLSQTVREVPPAAGVGKVLMPGDQEILTRDKRQSAGVEVPEQTWRGIVDVAEELSIHLPSPNNI